LPPVGIHSRSPCTTPRPDPMNTQTTPRRIGIGFFVIIVLTLLLGIWAIWQILAINRNVVQLAANAVPSVVTLNKIIQSNATAAQAVVSLIEAIGNGKQASSEEASFMSAKSKGDELMAEYEGLLSDAEDTRLFKDAKSARASYLTAVQKALELAREQNQVESLASLKAEAEPALNVTVDLFNKDIDYNITLATKETVMASSNVMKSLYTIIPALALATLLGGLIGWSTVQSTKNALASINDQIQAGIDKTNDALTSISDSLQQGADQTASSSTQLSSASRALATGCSEQGASVTETSASLEEISAMIRATADNASKAKEFAGQARSAALTGKQTMAEMTVAMMSIETSSLDISKIVKNIDEIAFQTNILALNAAVEAARAGEAGAGFAVVADEVRSLAQRSAAAAKETADKIEAAIASTKRGSKSCSNVSESLEEIVNKVTEADVLVAEIASAAKEQAQGIKQVGVAMTQMDKVTQGNASNAEQTSTAAEQLNSQAKLLQDNVEHLQSLIASTSQSGSDEQAVASSRRPRASGKRPGATGQRQETAVRSPAERRRPEPQLVMPEEPTYRPDADDGNFRNF